VISEMTNRLSRNWWAIALRGVVAIAFGVLAFLWPGLTLYALVILFGAFAIVDGVLALVGAFRRREGRRPDFFLIIGGLAGIAAGIIAFVLPGLSALALLYVIAAWAIVTGIAEVVAAYQLREEIRGEWLLALSGAVSFVFGLFIALFPGPGALAVVWLIAAYAIVSGVILLALAFRLRARLTASDDRGSDRQTART
jgi:uncharacterized membrane protein HdeD (DUF308 family)